MRAQSPTKRSELLLSRPRDWQQSGDIKYCCYEIKVQAQVLKQQATKKSNKNSSERQVIETIVTSNQVRAGKQLATRLTIIMSISIILSSSLFIDSCESRRINFIPNANATPQPPSVSHYQSKHSHYYSAPAADRRTNDVLQLEPSNRTSFFMDEDTNSTSAASVSDHQAITKSVQQPTADRDRYENISLALQEPPSALSLMGADEVVFDDDEEGGGDILGEQNEDEDDDYEDESDFYNSNPVDSIEFSLDADDGLGALAAGKKLASEQSANKSSSGTFDDFDDYQALKLDTFYDGASSDGKRRKRPNGNQLTKKNRSMRGRRRHRRRGRKKPRIKKAKSRSGLSGNAGGGGQLARASERHGAEEINDNVAVNDGDEGVGGDGAVKKKKQKGGAAGHSLVSSLHNHSTSESVNPQEENDDTSDNNASADCALPLDSAGRCLTFESVEWAIRRARRLIRFRQPSRRALNSQEPDESTIHGTGELVEWTSRLLAIKWNLTPGEINDGLENVDVSRTSLWSACPRIYRSPLARPCRNTNAAGSPSPWAPSRFRTHTGQCNNPLAPHLGSSLMPFVRLTPPRYLDNIGSIRRSSLSGAHLPPARLVSLSLHPNFEQLPASDHSALFASWGQLVNHDLAMASGARVATGHDGSCCSRSVVVSQAANGQSPDRLMGDPLNRVCLPILIGHADPVYAAHGIRCHEFKRSVAGLRPGCSLGPRTQLNLVSSFVDGSFVYGSARSVNLALRRAGGQLATWNYFRRQRLKPLLPPQMNEPDDECLARPRGLYCFRSGDMRTNQQVALVVMHTIHTRHHNRLASALARLNPHWSGARLYEEARHIHVAQIQHILLSEYLPLLLGEQLCRKYNLVESGLGEHWDHYEPTENPGISQEFAAAAFRQGHSSVPNNVYRFDVVSRAPRRFYPLRELFRQPWPLFEPGAVDEFLLGLIETPAQSVDPFVSLELTGHLLEEPDEPVGLDLIAINIQRGRDQGVASYNSMRQWCGLERLNNFQELASVMSNSSSQLMAELYESVDDIDLYSGGLSEFPLEGAQVGPTFACIIGQQFQTLRLADRYWFESSAGPQAFSLAQLDSIKQFTLARLVCANSDGISFIQASAMQLPHPIYNPLQPCADLPDLDLSLWFEPPPPPQQQQDEDEQEDDDDR